MKEELDKGISIFKDFFYDNSYVMCIYDAETLIILDINKSGEEFYGYSRHDIIGQTITDTINPFISKDIILKYISLILSGKQKNFYDLKHRLKNGKFRDVQVSLTIVYLNGKMLVISTILDVTDKIAKENTLIHSNAELDKIKLFYSVLTAIIEIE